MARFAELTGRPAAISMAAVRWAIAKTINFITILFIVINSPLKKSKRE
jgi:hypothetical protein